MCSSSSSVILHRAYLCNRCQPSDFATTYLPLLRANTCHQAKTCLQEMKQSVKQMLQMLPEYCLVGLITYGAMVTGVHLHTFNLLMLTQVQNACCAIACHYTQTPHSDSCDCNDRKHVHCALTISPRSSHSTSISSLHDHAKTQACLGQCLVICMCSP